MSRNAQPEVSNEAVALLPETSPITGSPIPETRLNEGWIVLGISVALALMTWLVFGQTLQNDFVNYDDDAYVYRNGNVSAGLSFQSVAWAFTHVHSSNWHPLTWMSHMLDCQLYGLKPAGHHLTNILLHAATAVALFLVLRRMTGALWRSALVAALFALHPLRVESVAWIAERKDVLSGLFFMLTLWAYSRHAQRRSGHPGLKYDYALALIFFTLGLLSKPMLVTLPFVLLLLDVWPLQRFSRSAIPRLLAEKIPFLLLSGAVCVITVFSQEQAMSSLSWQLRAGNAVVSCVVYLKQIFYPVGLAVFYPHPEGSLATGKILAASILLLGISAGAIAAFRRRPWLLVGWLWYLGMLVPVIGILQVGSQAQADRYTYLSQIGVNAMLVWSLAELCDGWRWRRVVMGSLAAIVLVTLMLGARVQARFWRDSESLWLRALACTPENVVAHNNLGNALFEKKHIDEAIAQFQEALRLKPDHAEAHYNLANALLKKGKADEAVLHYGQALQIKPDDAKFNYHAGIAYLQKEEWDSAILCFQRALQIDPDDVTVRNNLGNALLKKGRIDEAMTHYEQALRMNPKDGKPHYNLGVALMQQGRIDEAVARFQQYLKVAPDDVVVRNNLGSLLFQKGQVDEAIAQFQQAVNVKPNDIDAHINLGRAMLQKENLDEAILHFQIVLRAAPDNAQAHYHLGTALLQKGNVDLGTAHFRQAAQLQPDYPEALNNLAWQLATSPQASARNGAEAVVLARRASQLTGEQDVDVLDTLAAAYAEAGQYDDAVRTVGKAITTAQASGHQDQLNQLNRELKLYQARQPFHRETQ